MKKTFLFLFLFLLIACSKNIVKNQEQELPIKILTQNKSPLVFNKILFAGGSLYDVKGGEVYLLSRILQQSALSLILENQGSFLKTEAEYDYFTLNYEILAPQQKETFLQVINFLLNYEISEKEFILAKNQLWQELKLQEDQFYDKVRFKFYQELYQNHRYAAPLSGTEKTIKNLTLKDVKLAYQKLILSSLGGLVLVGQEENNSENLKFYTKILSSFKVKKWDSFKTQSMPLEKKHRVVIPASSTQVFVRIGGLGIPRNHPDYLQYLIISDMIGGGFGSLITKRLREEQGLTYSPVANFYSLRQEKGYFFTAYSTRQENLEKSLVLIEEIFDELANNGISLQNFKMSCQYMHGIFLVKEETYASLARILAEEIIFNLPKDNWEKSKKMILNLDYQEVNKKIKKYFKNRKFLTVILKKT